MRYEKVKIKREKVKAFLNIIPTVQNINARAELIQSFTPIALLHTQRMRKDEVYKLVGKRYQRCPNYYLWGKQGGSIYISASTISRRYIKESL